MLIIRTSLSFSYLHSYKSNCNIVLIPHVSIWLHIASLVWHGENTYLVWVHVLLPRVWQYYSIVTHQHQSCNKTLSMCKDTINMHAPLTCLSWLKYVGTNGNCLNSWNLNARSRNKSLLIFQDSWLRFSWSESGLWQLTSKDATICMWSTKQGLWFHNKMLLQLAVLARTLITCSVSFNTRGERDNFVIKHISCQ